MTRVWIQSPFNSSGQEMLHSFLGDLGATQYENIRSRMQITTLPMMIHLGDVYMLSNQDKKWLPNWLVVGLFSTQLFEVV